ncbi:MAG: ADP-glyceromanno-heptose 6-epimerase [Planctomycetota bacterium]
MAKRKALARPGRSTPQLRGWWRRVVVTGGAGFIGSNLALEIERRYPNAEVVVVDDFRSGSFGNLRTFRGDVVAADVSRTDLEHVFGGRAPSSVFHLASITDTTVSDASLMVHDNVEGFRRVLRCALALRLPLVYASSAATYGVAGRRMSEETPARPANVYAFSKMIMDNIARRAIAGSPGARITGLRYFNVYGPGEWHKKDAASMIYKLARQILAGERPWVCAHGEHKRDFVYVKDVVEATILAAESRRSGVYNVGSGRARSFNEVIQILNRELGGRRETEYVENPYAFYQPFTEADLSACAAALGYAPRWGLEEGIRDYLSEIRAAAG